MKIKKAKKGARVVKKDRHDVSNLVGDLSRLGCGWSSCKECDWKLKKEKSTKDVEVDGIEGDVE